MSLLVSALCPIVCCIHPIFLIDAVRFEKRAPNSNAVAYASSTLDGSSPTGRKYRPGLVHLKSVSSAPRQKSKTKPTHRYCLPRCPLAAPHPRFPPCHGFTVP